MVDEEGRLQSSADAFDRRVAGVVSGSGDLKSAIVLGRHTTEGHRLPVALLGQVYCQVDADCQPICVGDPLVSSDTPGHARATHDVQRAFGAVLGKALESLEHGRGRIRVLVSLQ
ncbi:MAG: hypothetical protein AAGC60_20725 [Acidobacteriota bacterium]